MNRPAPCKNCKNIFLLTSDGLCITCSSAGEVPLKRIHALQILGGCCKCCGESDHHFLDIDHTFNDGKEHRKQLKNLHTSLYQWIKENHGQANTDLQVLCANCHAAKTRYGFCPHVKKHDRSDIIKYMEEIEYEAICKSSKD